jgi:hypothetical protein
MVSRAKLLRIAMMGIRSPIIPSSPPKQYAAEQSDNNEYGANDSTGDLRSA